MKKFTKIALIVVLITGIVGGCLAGVGLVFGGSVRSITGNFTNSRLYHVLRRACRDHEGPWWDMDDDFNDYRHSLGDLDNFNHGSMEQREFLPFLNRFQYLYCLFLKEEIHAFPCCHD